MKGGINRSQMIGSDATLPRKHRTICQKNIQPVKLCMHPSIQKLRKYYI